MNVKKVVNFLVLRPAFTQRNISSILLVALFFGVYVLAGGKITTIPPNLQHSTTTFGGVDSREDPASAVYHDDAGQPAAEPTLTREESKLLLGEKPSEDRAAREKTLVKKGVLFDPTNPDDDPERAPIDKNMLVTGVDMTNHREEWKLKRTEPKGDDNLAAIEDRLNIKKRNEYKNKMYKSSDRETTNARDGGYTSRH